MTLLIAGGYSCGNPGDEAILKSTVYRLKELFGRAHFVIWTDAGDFRPQFDRDIDHELFYWKPLGWRRGAGFWSRLAVKLYTDLYPVSKNILAKPFFYDRRAKETLQRCDKVIFVGGGYINSDFCLLEMNYLAEAAARLGKPLHLLGQTLGPFVKPAHQRMAHDLFRRARNIVLRDEESREEVAFHAGKVMTGSDDAVGFEPVLAPRQRAEADACLPRISANTLRLGLSLRDWKGSRAHYSRIARALEWFSRAVPENLEVVFIPMETSRHCDDRLEAAEFVRHLAPTVDFVSIGDALSVEQLHHLIGRMDLMVGMRLHAMVFALSSGVPTVGLYQGDYYFRKISGLFGSFGVLKDLVPMDRIEELGPKLHALRVEAKKARSHLLASRARIVQNQKDLLARAVGSERTV